MFCNCFKIQKTMTFKVIRGKIIAILKLLNSHHKLLNSHHMHYLWNCPLRGQHLNFTDMLSVLTNLHKCILFISKVKSNSSVSSFSRQLTINHVLPTPIILTYSSQSVLETWVNVKEIFRRYYTYKCANFKKCC